MATLTKAINKNLFDSILPTFGNPRVHIPVWDDSQKMFICDEYESGNGHRYYRGIRSLLGHLLDFRKTSGCEKKGK